MKRIRNGAVQTHATLRGVRTCTYIPLIVKTEVFIKARLKQRGRVYFFEPTTFYHVSVLLIAV